MSGGGVLDDSVGQQVEIQAKYRGYIERQRDEVARRAEQENVRLPPDLDYGAVRGLSKEVQQTLQKLRPETLGQAGRISGITPAAISLLLVHLKRSRPSQKLRA
jgi:tRNA uridine 5-carboxymethylaminomethyl modification enzyme